MAGYKTAGSNFVNATLINNQADRQRFEFSQALGTQLGASNQSHLSSIFTHKDNLVGAEAVSQMDKIINSFKEADNKVGGGNPDFPNGVNTDYSNGLTAPNLDQLDLPNEFGPNIILPSGADVDVFDPNTKRDVRAGSIVPIKEDGAGFGNKIDRNNRSIKASDKETLGTYFKRFYDNTDATTISKPTLGQFAPDKIAEDPTP